MKSITPLQLLSWMYYQTVYYIKLSYATRFSICIIQNKYIYIHRKLKRVTVESIVVILIMIHSKIYVQIINLHKYNYIFVVLFVHNSNNNYIVKHKSNTYDANYKELSHIIKIKQSTKKKQQIMNVFCFIMEYQHFA